MALYAFHVLHFPNVLYFCSPSLLSLLALCDRGVLPVENVVSPVRSSIDIVAVVPTPSDDESLKISICVPLVCTPDSYLVASPTDTLLLRFDSLTVLHIIEFTYFSCLFSVPLR